MKGSRILSIRSKASFEIVEAAAWYEKRAEGLGEKLKADIEKACNRILNNPEAFTKINKGSRIRRIILEKFPYKIFFTFTEAGIEILAIIHASRSNAYIKR